MLRLLCVLLLGLCPVHVSGNDWDAIAQPGTILLMRHALAPGTSDPTEVVIGDCSTQRNLDDRGRNQARDIGAALRARGIKIDEVWTSQWCRCRETAQLLAIAPVRDEPALNSFFTRRDRAKPQTEAIRAALSAAPPQRRLLVTHQVNITALTGQSTRSGEIIVAVRDADGMRVTGRILIAP